MVGAESPEDEDARLHSLTRVGRKLRNSDRAFVPGPKLTRYLLDPGNKRGKAKLFKRELGMALEHRSDLEAQLVAGASERPIARILADKPPPAKPTYEVWVPIRGVNGATREVLTAWTYEGGRPQLVTAYPARQRDWVL